MTGTIRRDITIQQGADFEWNIEVQNSDKTPMDLTGWTAAMQVRATAADSTKLVDITTGGGITINAPGGIVIIDIPKATTQAYTWTNGVYDVEITNGSKTRRIAQGFASLSPEVTR